MDEETGTELGLEPCGLRRHDIAGVGNVDQLLHRDRIKGESHLHLSGVHAAGKLPESADSSDEVYPLVCTKVLDSKDGVKDEVRKDRNIQYSYRILVIIPSGKGLERVPLTVKVHREVVEMVRMP